MARLGDLGSAVLGALYADAILATAGVVVVIALATVVAFRRGWLRAARRHPGRSGALVVAALAVGLPLGWYLASPLVLSTSIDEPTPVIAAEPSAPSTTAVPPASDRPARPAPTVAPSAAPPLIARAGSFHGSDEFHFGRGTARLIEVSPGSFVVRLEDFAVRNGPDLYVYVSPSADGYARDAIELGRLKADSGNQNYRVPAGALTDPTRAASVVIWCKQFSHLFATAPLAG
jgi:Electron transfer DM13